jgi:hypothetical protein
MDTTTTWFLVAVAVIGGLPAWFAGNVIKRNAKQDGATASDWIPFSVLVYALRRFRHPKKGAIVFAYTVFNLLSWAAIGVLVYFHWIAKR